MTLLREENARLKSERHRRLDVGTLIDKMRLVASEQESDDTLADARAVLAECIAIREELEDSCDEMQAAIATLREQLAGLGVGIAVPAPGGG